MTPSPNLSAADRRGASAVEMAVVLPVLLLLGFACVDFGRALSTYFTVSNAARVGADYAATHRVTSFTRNSWSDQIRSDVEAEMAGVQAFDAGKLTVTSDYLAGADGQVQATVTSRYVLTPLVAWPGLPSEYPLERKVVVRQYR